MIFGVMQGRCRQSSPKAFPAASLKSIQQEPHRCSQVSDLEESALTFGTENSVAVRHH